MMPVQSNEADGFAIAMLLFMVCSFGVIALLVFTIFRNAAKRNREVEELIDEVEREEKKEKAPAVPKSAVPEIAEPWEREGDWWKKG